AAVAAAADTDAVRIGDAVVDGPLHGVHQVVVHLGAPLAVARVEEGLAEAGGAPEVDAQDRVAAVGQPLVDAVVAPVVAGPRAAVHLQHHRQRFRRADAVFGLVPRRQGQVADQVQAVPGPDDD